jgi:hypothetical protein
MPRKTTPKPAKPRIDPELERACVPLIDALTCDDEGRRRAASSWLLGVSDAYGLRQVGEMLLAVLARGPAPRRDAAGESLKAIGPAALPAVLYRLHLSKAAAMRVRLLDIIAALGPKLAEDRRVDLFFDLMTACGKDGDENVLRSLAGAIAALGLGGQMSHLAGLLSVPPGP